MPEKQDKKKLTLTIIPPDVTDEQLERLIAAWKKAAGVDEKQQPITDPSQKTQGASLETTD